MLANEFFESDCTATLSFARASRADEYPDFDHVERDEGAAWIGYVAEASAETRALAGVSHDPEFPEGFDPSFDAESQTCAFTKEEPLDLWFGTRTVSTPYTYSFNGRAWTRAAGEAESSLAISPGALDGAYGSGEGDAVRMGAFKVVNFDAADNTFTIEYRASTSGLSPQTISGVISCTLEGSPAEEGRETYRQSDGYVYAFHGQGTSTGGEGTSQIEGYLGSSTGRSSSSSRATTRSPRFCSATRRTRPCRSRASSRARQASAPQLPLLREICTFHLARICHTRLL